ncbi:hypothetical protein P5V15_014526 [Pogonomyrmex californicus]
MLGISSEDCRASTTTSSGNIDQTGNTGDRRMSHFKEYKFFRSFSAKVENWPMRKAEALWRRMRERKIAGKRFTDSLARLRNSWISRKIVYGWCNMRVTIYLWRPIGLIIDHNINAAQRSR